MKFPQTGRRGLDTPAGRGENYRRRPWEFRMPPPPPPRRRPANDDDGFEVVDEAPPPKARPLPPLPGQSASVPPPAPRPAAKAPPPAAKPALPAAKPAPKPAPKPAFEVVDDTEIEVKGKAKTAEVRKPPRAARDDDEDDDRPRRRRDEDDDDDRPRKKKGKKKKGSQAQTGDSYADEVREQRLREFEYTWPTVFLVLGVGMAVTGAIGAGGAAGTLSVILVLAGLFVSIPIAIVTLMVVGAVCGINYGRFGPAILKIAAITFIVNGIYFICEWLKVPIYVAGPIGCAAAFGLFKTMFDLDNGETNTSMGAINVVSFLLKWLVIILVAIIVSKSGGKLELDEDGNPVQTDTRSDRGKWKNPGPTPRMNPADEPDDPDDDDP